MKEYIPIKKKISRRLALRGLICLAICIAIFGVGYLTTLIYPNKTGYALTVYVFSAALCALVIYKSNFFQLLMEKDFEGEIISKVLWNGNYFSSFGTRHMLPTVFMDLEVKKSDSAVVKITYNTAFISKSAYNVGNRVVYLSGAKYLLVTDKNTPIFCPLCAETLDTPECPNCKITFVNYKKP